MSHYQVIFDGTTAPGHSVDQVKQRLCRLFKKDRAAIERLFSGRPVAIRKNIDHATARKLKNAMDQAGALCRIEKIASAKVEKGRTEPAPSKNETQGVSVVTPVKCPALLQYAPLTCAEISAWDKGINLNRKDRQEIPFSAIGMASVFQDSSDNAHPLKFMFFLYDQPRPLLANAETIRFKDFPGGSGSSLIDSLRSFVKLLVSRHPRLILDVETYRFLQKGRPQLLDRGIDAFATSLGKALETQVPVTAAPEKELGNAANRVLPGTVVDEVASSAGSYQATSQGAAAVKKNEPELTPEQRRTLRSRHRRKAVIFLVLSIFFGLGFAGTTTNVIQELNRDDSQPSFYRNIAPNMPALKRQLELLEYNRKMNKVTMTLSLVVCFVLTLFFFGRSRHHFRQARE